MAHPFSPVAKPLTSSQVVTPDLQRPSQPSQQPRTFRVSMLSDDRNIQPLRTRSRTEGYLPDVFGFMRLKEVPEQPSTPQKTGPLSPPRRPLTNDYGNPVLLNSPMGLVSPVYERTQSLDACSAGTTQAHSPRREDSSNRFSLLRKVDARKQLRHSWPRCFAVGANMARELEGEASAELAIASRNLRLNDISWGPQIAEGTFGRVYLARHHSTARDIVLKELKHDHADRDAFIKEMNLLKMLSHPNILEYIGMFCKARELFLVTEYISGGTLEAKLADTSAVLSWELRCKWGMEIAAGGSFIHGFGVLHRDLKRRLYSLPRLLQPENIMLRADLAAVIVDFGLARMAPGETLVRGNPSLFGRRMGSRRYSSHENMVGTVHPRSKGSVQDKSRPMSGVGSPYWRAPEVATNHYSYPVDVFSFGIMLAEIIGRVSADPDEMPRRHDFGIDEAKFSELYGAPCPPTLLAVAFQCASVRTLVDVAHALSLSDVIPSERPSFSRAESTLRVQWIKLQPQLGAVGSRKGSFQLVAPPRLSPLSSESGTPVDVNTPVDAKMPILDDLGQPAKLSFELTTDGQAASLDDDAASLPTREVQAWVSYV